MCVCVWVGVHLGLCWVYVGMQRWAIRNAGDAPRDAPSDTGDVPSDATKDAEDATRDAGDATGDATRDVPRAAGDATRDAQKIQPRVWLGYQLRALCILCNQARMCSFK